MAQWAVKQALRACVKERVGSVAYQELKAQSVSVAAQLLKHKKYQAAKRVSIYLSTEKELSTDLVIEDIFRQAKACFVPRFTPTTMDMFKVSSLADIASLPTAKWGIRQPDDVLSREEAIRTGGLDLIVVPGVAFTKSGCRLGHGKGYYDTYIKRISELSAAQGLPKPYTIGLAFTQQELEDIPMDEHDIMLDEVLFPSWW